MLIERADDEEDMEIDYDYTVDTMKSNITTGLTITRSQGHSFGSSTSSGQYYKDIREWVTSWDDLLSGESLHLSISGTK